MPIYIKNKDLLNEIIISKNQDSLTGNAVNMIQQISSGISTKLSYKYEQDREDCIANGVFKAVSYWRNFDPQKSNNAFAYFTQVIKNGHAEQFKKLRPLSEANCVSLTQHSSRLL